MPNRENELKKNELVKPYSGSIVAEHNQDEDDQAANIVALRPRLEKSPLSTQARAGRWGCSRRRRFWEALCKTEQRYVACGRHDSIVFGRKRYQSCRPGVKIAGCCVLWIPHVLQNSRVLVLRRCQTNMENGQTVCKCPGTKGLHSRPMCHGIGWTISYPMFRRQNQPRPVVAQNSGRTGQSDDADRSEDPFACPNKDTRNEVSLLLVSPQGSDHHPRVVSGSSGVHDIHRA